jgi:DNA-binding response OmpR family regulator
MAEPKTVLVVEDDPLMREFLCWALEDQGLEVVAAADGRQAVSSGGKRRPGLVVLDLNLPELDGVAVAHELRGMHGSELPILVVSADTAAAAKARQVGAFAFLRKPFEIEHLLTAVHSGLGAP